jgi:DNA-binding GntR family transcriptional regulator
MSATSRPARRVARANAGARQPSLVDTAEVALRNWLAPGRHRPGDRLPPEHDLAAMLGISRGTLRAALQRLEGSGEIVRRQGSGTFVGRVGQTSALDEGLERLEPYSSIARDRGTKLSVADLSVERVAATADAAQILSIEPGTEVVEISRVLVADGHPSAKMIDILGPLVDVPADGKLRRALEKGNMVLDILHGNGTPVAYATTHIRPRLVTAREPLGRDLGIDRTTAVLDLEEVFHVTTGAVLYFSRDIFAPGGLDLHVLRWLEAARPEQVSPRRMR